MQPAFVHSKQPPSLNTHSRTVATPLLEWRGGGREKLWYMVSMLIKQDFKLKIVSLITHTLPCIIQEQSPTERRRAYLGDTYEPEEPGLKDQRANHKTRYRPYLVWKRPQWTNHTPWPDSQNKTWPKPTPKGIQLGSSKGHQNQKPNPKDLPWKVWTMVTGWGP